MTKLVCGVLFLRAGLSVLGQVPDGKYGALKQALGLSNSQLAQLEQTRPAGLYEPLGVQPAGPGQARSAGRLRLDPPSAGQYRDPILAVTQARDALRAQMLDGDQREKLALIEKVLERSDMASLGIVLGLIDVHQWPGRALCYGTIRSDSSQLDLSDFQVQQFERLQRLAQEHSKPGTPGRPPRDVALSVLDDVQKAKLAAFEAALQLASEAIDLRLFPPPPGAGSDVLCP